jgi:hypothetical protein
MDDGQDEIILSCITRGLYACLAAVYTLDGSIFTEADVEPMFSLALANKSWAVSSNLPGTIEF